MLKGVKETAGIQISKASIMHFEPSPLNIPFLFTLFFW
jgi:hypothetical protein